MNCITHCNGRNNPNNRCFKSTLSTQYILDWAPCPPPFVKYNEFLKFVKSLEINISVREIEDIATRCRRRLKPDQTIEKLPVTGRPSSSTADTTNVFKATDVQSASTFYIVPVLVVLAVVFIIAIVIALLLLWWRRRKRRTSKTNVPECKPGENHDKGYVTDANTNQNNTHTVTDEDPEEGIPFIDEDVTAYNVETLHIGNIDYG